MLFSSAPVVGRSYVPRNPSDLWKGQTSVVAGVDTKCGTVRFEDGSLIALSLFRELYRPVPIRRRVVSAARRRLISFLGLDAERERVNANLRHVKESVASLDSQVSRLPDCERLKADHATLSAVVDRIDTLQQEQQRLMAALEAVNGIDSDDVVEALLERFDASDIAPAIDLADLAYYIESSNIAEELSVEAVASCLDAGEIADAIDSDYIAREIMKRVADAIVAHN